MTTRGRSIPKSEDAEDRFSFLATMTLLWAERKSVAFAVFILTSATLVIVLLLPPKFTAETSILPELEKNKLLGMAGMADLAALTGVDVGQAPVSKLYPMIIKSARILKEVIYSKYATSQSPDSLNLIRFWELKGNTESERFELALKVLQSRMDVSFDNRLGTLILKVEMEQPNLAADVANRVTSELDMYTRTKRRTSVTLQREFIQQRMTEVEGALKTAENALKTFRENNRRVSDSPQLLLEQARHERELQINSTIYIELKKQIEIAKIEEIKNIPIINVLDEARVPIRRSSPQRVFTVVLVFFVSLVGSSITVIASTNQQVRSGFRMLREVFSNRSGRSL